MKIVKHR